MMQVPVESLSGWPSKGDRLALGPKCAASQALENRILAPIGG